MNFTEFTLLNGATIIINLETVTAVFDITDGSNILLTNGSNYFVRESYDQMRRMLVAKN